MRPTVAGIRPRLRCSQARAAQLRRTIIATLDPTDAAPRSPRARPRLVHVASLARVAQRNAVSGRRISLQKYFNRCGWVIAWPITLRDLIEPALQSLPGGQQLMPQRGRHLFVVKQY
ncbi:hypothetical protein [Burkholderia territorii]|uniref:hypothetical protein n=1 Tax=Burkholderia territorii TaxID=1503055 RepID=UPI000AEF3021|nr:hypothetical protein [Burkholderia territorii]